MSNAPHNSNTQYLLQLPNGDQFTLTGNINTDEVMIDGPSIKIPHIAEDGSYGAVIIPHGSLLIPLEQSLQPTHDSIAAMDAKLQESRATVATLEAKLKAERSMIYKLREEIRTLKDISIKDADKLVQQERQLAFLATMTVALFIAGVALAFKLWG